MTQPAQGHAGQEVSRSEQQGPWRPVRRLVLPILVYVAVIGGLLAYTDFLPYVTDNNESFSAIVHARNILRFGLKSTAGLADEVNGGLETAHPYVYTHGGNFPRLPALALLLVGIDSVESQITILALLVGCASIVLCYEFFSRIGGNLLALIVVTVLSTDYLLFVQWQVNTFRVWHALFFFVGMRCVQALNDRNRRSVGVALFLNAIGLFYLEMVFAVFVTLFTGFYAAVLHRHRPARITYVLSAIVLGGAVAMGGLLVQVFGHLGAARAIEDIRLTFLSRNFDVLTGAAAQARKLSFFIDNHIVYWDSSFNPSGFLAFDSLKAALHEGIVKVYTPFLGVFTAIIGIAVILAGEGFVSSTEPQSTTATRDRIVRRNRFRIRRFVLATAFVLLVAWTLVGPLRLSSPAHISLSQGDVQYPIGASVLQLALVGSFIVGLFLVVNREGQLAGWEVYQPLRGIAWYVLSGSAALLVTHTMLPGYVWNGYLSRYAPLHVFTSDVWLAFVLYALLMLTLGTDRVCSRGGASVEVADVTASAAGRQGTGLPKALRLLSAVLLLFVSWYWIRLQIAYFSKLPPTAITFMRQLSGPEYKGASFVSDNYALPIAYFTGQWAYQDHEIAENAPMDTKGGRRTRIAGTYIWFADRETNDSYLRPQYYLCRINPDLNSAAARVSPSAEARRNICSKQPLVGAARRGQSYPFRHSLVASDPSDMWAIIKLDPSIHLVRSH